MTIAVSCAVFLAGGAVTLCFALGADARLKRIALDVLDGEDDDAAGAGIRRPLLDGGEEVDIEGVMPRR